MWYKYKKRYFFLKGTTKESYVFCCYFRSHILQKVFVFVIFAVCLWKGHEKTSYSHSLQRFSLEFLMTFCYSNDVNVFVAIGVKE